MKTTTYKLKSTKLDGKIRVALVSDLHDRCVDAVIKALERERPDIIAVVGDLTSRLDCSEGEIPCCDNGRPVSHAQAFRLLRASAELAPTYYSLGNHELCGHKYRLNAGRLCRDENLKLIADSGVTLLDDSFVKAPNGILIGGLTSGHTNEDLIPHTGWLEGFSALDGFKLLLCHHPEYYPKYLSALDMDLILSGHAHGGQIRLFGRGLYAPGQGILPKYTSGVHDGRLVIGRGLANTGGIIPRLFNRRELVMIEIN